MYGNIYRQPPQPHQQRPSAATIPQEAPPEFVPCNRMATMMAIAVCWGAVSNDVEPLWQNALVTEVVVNDPPPRRTQPESIIAAWHQAYAAAQRRVTAPIAPAAAEQPPYKRQPESIYQAWVALSRIDRWQISVSQAVEVNDPPPSSRAGFYAVMRHWIPPDPAPVQRVHKQIVSVEAAQQQPPPVRPLDLSAWYQPHHPAQRRVLIAPLTLVYGDQPPPLKRQAILQGEPEQPQQRRSLTIVSVDQPPPLARRQPLSLEANQPQQRRVTYPIAPVVVAEQPPFKRQPESILASWQGYDITQRRNQITPLTLIYGDQPSPRSHVVLDAIVRTWEPPHHYDWRRPKFVFGVQVDNPPPLKVALINSLYQINWIPPAPQPQQRDLKIVPLTLVYGDQPPPLVRRVPYWPLEHDPQPRLKSYPHSDVVVAELPPLTRQPEAIAAAWQTVDFSLPRQRFVAHIPPRACMPPTHVNGAIGSDLSGDDVSEIDEPPETPDDQWVRLTGSLSLISVTFDPPAGPLQTGAGLQRFRVLIRRVNPVDTSWRIELREFGTFRATLATGTLTDDSPVIVDGSWDAALLTIDPGGSAVSLRFVQTSATVLDVGAMEWCPTYGNKPPPRSMAGLMALLRSSWEPLPVHVHRQEPVAVGAPVTIVHLHYTAPYHLLHWTVPNEDDWS